MVNFLAYSFERFFAKGSLKKIAASIVQGGRQIRRAGVVRARLTLRVGFGNRSRGSAGVKEGRIQGSRHVIGLRVIRHACQQQLVPESLWMVLAPQQHKNS